MEGRKMVLLRGLVLIFNSGEDENYSWIKCPLKVAQGHHYWDPTSTRLRMTFKENLI